MSGKMHAQGMLINPWEKLVCDIMESTTYRVDKVLGFSLSRPNWDPLTRRRFFPSPFGSRGTHSLAGEGLWGSQFGRGTDTGVL